MNATQWTKCRKAKSSAKWHKGEFKEWISVRGEESFISLFDLSARTLARWKADNSKIPPVYWYLMMKDRENNTLKELRK